MICKECPYMKELHGRFGVTKQIWCNHLDQDHIRSYFEEHLIKKAVGFIGFTNSEGKFPIKGSPKWCPLKRSDTE